MTFELKHLYVARQRELDELVAAIQHKVQTRSKAGGRTKRKHEDVSDDSGVVFKLEERVDMDALQWVKQNGQELLSKGEWTHFLNYAREMEEKGGLRTVSYLKSKRTNHGRVYPDGSLSLGSLKKELRSTLARNMYHDIDMSNAHPRILRNLAMLLGRPCKMIVRYNENREAALSELEYPRDVSKNIYLAMMMLGSHVSVLNAAGIESHSIPPNAEFFKDEVVDLAEHVYKANPQYHDLAKDSTKKSHNKYATVLSFVLQEKEMEIRAAAFEFVNQSGRKIGVSIHDGFLIYRQPGLEITQQFFTDLQIYVHKKTGIDMPFEEKEFKDPFF